MYGILTDYYNKYILSLSRNFLIIIPKFCSSMVLWLHYFQYSVCSHLCHFPAKRAIRDNNHEEQRAEAKFR